MDVRAGYKRTEVGVIPEDWGVSVFGELFEFHGGYTATRAQLSEVGHCYLHYGDIHTSTRSYVDLEKQLGELPRLDVPLSKVPTRSLLRDGDVVFVDASEDLAGTSKYQVVLNATGRPLIAGLHTLVARSKRDDLLREYKTHCFQSQSIRDQFAYYSVGTKVSGVNKSTIRRILVPTPPHAEQEVIATVLSDADALIESLEQLLAKKRQVKQGAMQELLTGRRRLAGFEGEWEVRRLAEFGSTFGGLTGKVKNDFGRGDARYITFMNIMTNVVIDCDSFDHVHVKPAESQNRVSRGDLFFNGSSETPEEVGMCATLAQDVQDVFLNSFCFGFRFHVGVLADGLYFAYFFRSGEGRALLKSLAQGATRYNLSKTALLRLAFPIPQLREQSAIASILSDMDAEIAAIETKLAKARQIKQGMMQELLTGRIRLV